MEELKIHDIKELVEIPDFSLYIYLTLWILGVALFCIIIFLIYRYFKYRNTHQRKVYYKILKELNLKDSKNAAYTITKYGRLLAKTEREKKFLAELIEELEPFKYKKEVGALSSEAKIIFGRFLDNIDV